MRKQEVKEKNIGTILLLFVFSCLIGVFTLLSLQIHDAGYELYASSDSVQSFVLTLFGQANTRNILLAVGISTVISLMLIMYYSGSFPFLNRIHHYRYAIAFCIVFIIVALDINNTSLYKWTDYIGLTGGEENGPFWGVARGIRMDEWGVWSPLTFSQAAGGFPAINNGISGGGINPTWISVGGIPAVSLAMIFKPFYWGFFVFGVSRGFSTLFALRIVLLFLTSYDLALIYTQGRRGLSFAAAAMITLSPYVQWWFSQSIAEVLIFGQAIILFFFRFFKDGDNRKRTIIAFVLAYFIGCYVMVGYPAWLISGAYLIVPACIFIAIRAKKKKHDWIRLGVPALVCLTLLGIIIYQTKDTLIAVMNSIYPGERMITGGGFSEKLAPDLYSIFLPFVDSLFNNASESSTWITFAPAGIILSVYQMIRNRKADTISCILLSIEFVFLLFCFIPFPEWLVRITLLSQINRPELVVGLCDLILLFRGLSQRREEWNAWSIVILSIACLFPRICYIISKQSTDELLTGLLAGIYLFAFLSLFACSAQRPKSGRFTVCVLCVVALLGGGFVNPLQQGTACISELKLKKAICDTGEKEDLWFVESGYPMTNFPLFAGKRVFDSTQPYPNIEKWADIDSEQVNQDKYNRFANISGALTDGDTEFTLIAPDHLLIQMSVDQLAEQGVKYILSPNQYETDESGLIQLIEVDGYRIYQIEKSQTGEMN